MSSSDDEIDVPALHVRNVRLRTNFALSEAENTARVRLTSVAIERLVWLVGRDMEPRAPHYYALTTHQRVMVGLRSVTALFSALKFAYMIDVLHARRFLADGGHYQTLGDAYGVSKQTVCTIVHQFCAAVVHRCYTAYVHWPSTQQALHLMRARFHERGRLPAVVAGMCEPQRE